ncbi:hypothetical protein BZA05DRAFT_428681 [Tricharina praecox]|uniref:uncharacterized protein n=1 Tax=Tricharina praecox TaxID=43433 RepID=UPI00221EAB25|nr:uncharacterized protein BZA05DRAFT_428681 [Tricharina praecox]KAI5857107.1 hypothetical protein BZA05DRAFT_428681 [Tricharina praecox]
MSADNPVDLPAAPVASPPAGTSATPLPPPPKASTPLAAPTQPTRPLSPNSQNQATLIEAFPNIDAAVVRAVLVASRGDLEPAFNALLSMSDPSAVVEEAPPPQPPRPRAQQHTSTSTPQNQLDADALYARQLQEHFGAPAPRQHLNAGMGGVRRANTGGKQPLRRHPNDESDDEYYTNDDRDRPSFFEEDLPVIKENIKKGFLETQAKVTGWFDEFRKKIDGEDQPEGSMGRAHGEQSPPQRTSGQYARTGNRRQYGAGGSYDAPRRSRDGYDADPKVLSDDFTHLSLKDNTESAPRRPKANPNLFQPSATTGRRVSFEDRPTMIDSTNDDDLYRPASATGNRSSPAGNSKWEPLKSVDAEPLHKDPFSLEDSDDEKDGLIKESEEKNVKKPISVTGPQETGVTKNP